MKTEAEVGVTRPKPRMTDAPRFSFRGFRGNVALLTS